MTASVASPNAPTSASAKATSPLPPGEGQGEGKPSLTEHFATIASAPNGIKKLRELILEMAVRGQLVPPVSQAEPVSKLLSRIAERRNQLIAEGMMSKQKEREPIREDEVPFELPDHWKWLRLGDICSYIQRGKGPAYVDKSLFPVVSQKCVRWSGLDLGPARFIDPQSIDKYEKIRFLRAGDILWNSTGTGTIGRACVVSDEDGGGRLVADSHVTVVRPIEVIPLFVWRYIQSPTVQSQIEGNASGTTNQIELNTSTVVSHLVPVPPIEEQLQIVEKVDELMALCDQLEAQQADAEAAHEKLVRELLATLTQSQSAADFQSNWQRLATHFDTLFTTEASIESLKQTLLQLAVMGMLVSQDCSDESVGQLLDRIDAERAALIRVGKAKKAAFEKVPVEEADFETPEGWRWVFFGQVTVSRLGKMLDKAKNKGEMRLYLRNTNVQWMRFDLDDLKQMRIEDYEKDEYRVEQGDLLICEGGEPGRCAIWQGEFPEIYCQKALHRVRPLGGVLPEYLQICLRIDSLTGRLGRYFTGATIKHFPGEKLSRYVLPLPPVREQIRIVRRLDELVAVCDQLKSRLNQALQLNEQLAKVLVENALN